MTDEEELNAQLFEVSRTMQTPGWQIILNEWGLSRERMIRNFCAATLGKEHGAEFYQGQIAGYDRATMVIDILNRKIEDRAKEPSSEA